MESLKADTVSLRSVRAERCLLAINWLFGVEISAVTMAVVAYGAQSSRTPMTDFVLAAVYAASLGAYVTLRMYVFRQGPSSGSSQECGALTRQLSRIVYLSLYGLMGCTVLVAIEGHRSFASDAHNLRAYVLAGLLVLCWIRVLTTWYGSAAPKAAATRDWVTSAGANTYTRFAGVARLKTTPDPLCQPSAPAHGMKRIELLPFATDVAAAASSSTQNSPGY